jgi:CRP/FNR family transcriptional regulator, dissimilatory nitrate respiration regulator
MAIEVSAFSPGSLAARLLAVLDRSRVIRHRFSRGATIFRQGDRATAMFLVETGRVRLARVLADGTSLILYVAQAGESFAEASLSAAHYHCDAIAETDAAVLALPKADLLPALAADPAECLALTLTLAAQVRDLRARLELRNIRSASTRVLAWLRLHASGNPPSVPMHRSWTQVADELGLTREVVYRALATLERQKWISRDANVVRLTTPPQESRSRNLGTAIG